MGSEDKISTEIPSVIRQAIRRGESFYMYRLSDTDIINYGRAGSIVPGIHEGGFVVAPFDYEYAGAETIIPMSECISEISDIAKDNMPYDIPACAYPFPSDSTSREKHTEGVKAISAYHHRHGGKTVLSRVITFDFSSSSVEDLFSALCVAYPSATVFCFSTPRSGLWLGATPEKLLSAHDGLLSTMSLAGTRRAGENEEWDSKNLEEQQLVTDFIVEAMSPMLPEIGKRTTLKAGPVEHICTFVTAKLNENFQPESILKVLSPTPALCGSDRKISMRLIAEWEEHTRGYYGGFFGPFQNCGDFDFFVNLRSMRLENNRGALFVGGGITGMSDPENEWIETERKSSTILRMITNISNSRKD